MGTNEVRLQGPVPPPRVPEHDTCRERLRWVFFIFVFLLALLLAPEALEIAHNP